MPFPVWLHCSSMYCLKKLPEPTLSRRGVDNNVEFFHSFSFLRSCAYVKGSASATQHWRRTGSITSPCAAWVLAPRAVPRANQAAEDQPEIRNRYRMHQPNLLPDKPTEVASRAQLPLNENPAAAGFTSECGLPLIGASTVAAAGPHQPKPE